MNRGHNQMLNAEVIRRADKTAQTMDKVVRIMGLRLVRDLLKRHGSAFIHHYEDQTDIGQGF